VTCCYKPSWKHLFNNHWTNNKQKYFMYSDEFNVIQCRILSQHSQYTVKVNSLHATLNARCFQSVCSSVTPWCVIPFSTNSSTSVYPPVHFPPEPHQSWHSSQRLSPEIRTVQSTDHDNIPGTNSIYAHAQSFAMSDELLVAILKASVPQQVKEKTIGFHMFTYNRHL
jgi:hypothetical protein